MILIGCSSQSTEQSSEDYNINETNECNQIVISNPYSSGGHYAGYEWAERTGGLCSGNSASFNEGCEEYYRQINQYNKCITNNR